MVDVICVDPESIHLIWPNVNHLVRRAYETGLGDDTFEDTELKVLDGKALLWVAIEDNKVRAVCTSELIQYGRRKLCILTAAAGDGCDWSECVKPIEIYAKLEGCEAVRLYGRQGWKRIFKDYSEPWVALEKRL